MKTQIDIDALIQATVRNEGLASPNCDFTQKVMSSLPKQDFHFESYKPLISRKALASIILIFILILVGVIILPNGQSESIFNISFFEKIQDLLENVNISFTIPSIPMYIIISALLMLLLQAFIISRYFRSSHR